VASFLHKLSPYYSFGRWLAVGDFMWRHVPPRDAAAARERARRSGRPGKKKLTNSRAGSEDSNKPLDVTLTLPKSSEN
jgi:hypothetical protein